MQKLTFDIQKIPEGQSEKSVFLPEDYFELKEGVRLLEADVIVSFYRTDHFVKVSFELNSSVELICDRCLDSYTDAINGVFDILFEPNEVEETETVKSAVRQIPADELALDIEEEVRDTIILNIPAKKIHPKYYDSDGNPEDFGTAKFGDIAPEDEEKIDPRWEKLKKLKQN